jgi:hypothetical protein
VLVAARARARRADDQTTVVATLVGEVLTGAVGMAKRPLPEHIERMLDELATARRGGAELLSAPAA